MVTSDIHELVSPSCRYLTALLTERYRDSLFPSDAILKILVVSGSCDLRVIILWQFVSQIGHYSEDCEYERLLKVCLSLAKRYRRVNVLSV